MLRQQLVENDRDGAQKVSQGRRTESAGPYSPTHPASGRKWPGSSPGDENKEHTKQDMRPWQTYISARARCQADRTGRSRSRCSFSSPRACPARVLACREHGIADSELVFLH